MTVLFDGIAFSPLRQARRSFIETGTSNHRDSGTRDTDGPEQKSVVEEAVMMTKTTVVVPKSEGTGCSNQLGILFWLPDHHRYRLTITIRSRREGACSSTAIRCFPLVKIAPRFLLYSFPGIAAGPLVHHPALLKILVARGIHGLKNCSRNRFIWKF